MVKIKLIDDEKKISIDGVEKYLSQEIGYVDYRKMFGDYLRSLEEQHCLENFFLYKGVPLYVFLRPAFSSWLSGILEKVYILDFIKRNYPKAKIITDCEVIKEINSFNFKLDLEFKARDKKKLASPRISKKNRVFRSLKGIHEYLKFRISRKEKIIMYSQAATIALDGESGEFKDVLYGDIQGELEKDFKVLNFQVLQHDREIYKSKRMRYNICPIEFLAIYKRIMEKKLLRTKDIKMDLSFVLEKEFRFMGYDISREIHDFFKKRAEKICMSYLKEIALIERIIKINRIKKVVVVDEGDRGRGFISAARISGVESFAIQHGIIVRDSHSYHLTTDKESVVPGKTFLWGEKYKRFLIESTPCYNEENLVVTGNLRMDNLQIPTVTTSNDRIRILFLSQYMDELVYGAGKILFEALAKINRDVEVIIKLHPTDNKYEEYYKKKIDETGVQCKIVKEEDLYGLLKKCDCVVSVHSTAILESALFKKPSICIRLPKYNDVCKFVEDGISYGAYNSEELSRIIQEYEACFREDYYQKMANNIDECFYKGKIDAENMIINEIRG